MLPWQPAARGDEPGAGVRPLPPETQPAIHIPEGNQPRTFHELHHQNIPDADADDIGKSLEGAIDIIMTPKNWDSFKHVVSQEDRNRFDKEKLGDPTEMDDQVAEFRKAWKAKYGGDFELEDKDNVALNNVRLERGGFIEATHVGSGAGARAGAKGVYFVMVVLPTSGTSSGAATGPAAVSTGIVDMTNQDGLWRIVVPGNLTAEELHNRLLKQIRRLNDDKNVWPDDPNTLYRAVASSLLQVFAQTTTLDPAGNVEPLPTGHDHEQHNQGINAPQRAN